MKTYYWHSYDDGKAIGAGVRIDAAEGGKKRYFQERLNGKELVESKGKNALPLYIAGAATRDSTPPPEEDMRALWQSYYDADYIFIVEGEKNAEDLNNAVKSYDEKIVVVTQGSSDYAKRWKDDAKELAKGVEEAVDDIKVYVFSDNDEPGRKAAKTTVQAFHDAGFANIFTLDMSLQYDGEEAVETYDISDYLDGGDLKALIAGARRYDPICEKALDAAKARKERRAERARIRAELEVASSMEDENFPVDALPDSFKRAALAMMDKYQKPAAAVVASLLCAFGCFLGDRKAVLIFGGGEEDENARYRPNFSVVLIGESNSGKSPLMKAALGRVLKIQEKDGCELKEAEIEKRRIRLEYLERQLNKLNSGKQIKETENELVDEMQTINAELSGAIDYCIGYKSPAGVDDNLDENARKAFERGIIPNGAVFFWDDAAQIFNLSDGAKKADNEYSRFNGMYDNKPGGKGRSVTQEKKQAKHRTCCGFFLGVQPSACDALIDNATKGNGFLNRLIYAPLNKKRGKRWLDISAETEPYYNFFDFAYTFPGAKFTLDKNAAEVYENWCETNDKRKANVEGDSAQESYIGKLENTVLQIALILHCAKCFESVLTTAIDAETVKAATRLTDAFLESRNACFRMVEIAIENRRKEKTLSRSPKAGKIYNAIIDAGLPLDLTEEAKEAGIKGLYAVELNDIRSLSCYKDRASRDAIDKELREAGLMILDGNKRVAIVYEEMQWHD